MTEYAPNVIIFQGKPHGVLNEALIRRQKITNEQLERLKELHVMKLNLFEEMKVSTSVDELKEGAKRLRAIEFAMQDNWNFSQDAGMHEWYLIPKCTCPKMDNMDRRYPGAPEGNRIMNLNCPVHGFGQHIAPEES